MRKCTVEYMQKSGWAVLAGAKTDIWRFFHSFPCRLGLAGISEN